MFCPAGQIPTGQIPTGLIPTGLIPRSFFLSPRTKTLLRDFILEVGIRSFFKISGEIGISPVGFSPVGISPVVICADGRRLLFFCMFCPAGQIPTGQIPTGLIPTGLIHRSPFFILSPRAYRTDTYRTDTYRTYTYRTYTSVIFFVTSYKNTSTRFYTGSGYKVIFFDERVSVR